MNGVEYSPKLTLEKKIVHKPIKYLFFVYFLFYKKYFIKTGQKKCLMKPVTNVAQKGTCRSALWNRSRLTKTEF